jgi:hypothetical protein
MFFKREKPQVLTFAQKMDAWRQAGYSVERVEPGTLARKGGFGALLREDGAGKPEIVDAGLMVGNDLALLTDAGFQKIFLTATNRKTPALAEHLKGLHEFTEDLREALGITSLYNQGLGTTNEKHLYDRVWHRDGAAQPKPWVK